MDLNQCTLIGNVGIEPQFHTFDNGGRSCKFTLATKRVWRDKTTEELREETTWHNIVVNAEPKVKLIEKAVGKGSRLLVQGEYRTRSYEKDGSKHYISELVVVPYSGNILIIKGKESGSSSASSGNDDSSELPAPDSVPGFDESVGF